MSKVARGGLVGLLVAATCTGAASAQGPDVAAALVQSAGQLVQLVRYELGGTVQGRSLEIRANALLGAAESFQRELLLRHNDPARRQRALAGLQQAFGQVQQALYNPPGQAPQAQQLTQQVIGPLVAQASQALPGGGIAPPITPVFPPTGPSYDARRVLQIADATVAGVRVLSQRIGRDYASIYPYNGVLLSLQSLDGGIQQFRNLAASGAPLGQLQAAVPPLRNLARNTGTSLLGARPPADLQRGWSAVTQGVDALATTLGLSLDYVIDAHEPVILDPPAYDDLPWNLRPGGLPMPGPNPVAVADQAIAEVDGFLLAIQPNLTRIPEGPRFQSDARSLRNRLLDLRQRLARGEYAGGLRSPYAAAESDYRRLADRINRVSGGRSGPNIERVGRIGQAMADLRGVLRI